MVGEVGGSGVVIAKSRVCTVVHYAVLEAIRVLYGLWEISPSRKHWEGV